ncbi:MAG TPA: PQQ-binding-like beta-propeller repeat protein [Planctomycetota bacterium]|nr:PQQ-binding-like beta-propeller repeat protein [Planctomycetota bacterium]
MRGTICGAALLALLLAGGRAGADSTSTRRARVDRFLVSVLREGVFLFDLRGQVIWSHRCEAYDAADAGQGQVLVTNRSAGSVFILGRDGTKVWEKGGLQGPVNAEPLPDGNVLVVENDSGRVVELTPAGSVVREFLGHRTPFDARRRPNGNTVVADSGNNRIVEYDPQGRKIRETPNLKFPNSLYLFPGGRTLFTTYASGSIGELDVDGTLLWEKTIGGTLYSIEAEGESLWVSDGAGGRVMRLSRDGTILQEIKLGKTFVDVAWCR